MFWATEQQLVYQANTISWNRWMTDVEVNELIRKSVDHVWSPQEVRKVDNPVNKKNDIRETPHL